MSLLLGGQREAPGTDRQETPPFLAESLHIQVRVQPEVKSLSQIKSFLVNLFFFFSVKLVQVWGSVTADLIRNEKVLIQSYLLLTSGSSFMPVCRYVEN